MRMSSPGTQACAVYFPEQEAAQLMPFIPRKRHKLGMLTGHESAMIDVTP